MNANSALESLCTELSRGLEPEAMATTILSTPGSR